MKKNDMYIKYDFFDKSYLMPYGQNIASHKKGICLNDSSAFLLEQLEEDRDYGEIVAAFMEHYDILDEDTAELKNDIRGMIDFLAAAGYMKDDAGISSVDYGNMSCYVIGRLCLGIDGDQTLIHEYFKKFSCEDKQVDQRISLIAGKPYECINGNVIVRSKEIIIMAAEDRYVILFPEQGALHEQHISKDGSVVNIYYNITDYERRTVVCAIYHALRFSYALAALNNGMVLLHSASVLYKDRAWLFSGSSGTGKSTHTNMWNEYYNAVILNGDLNMVGMEDGRTIVYGLPWCGTSGIYTEQAYELGGIVFLQQDSCNLAEQPDNADAALMFIQRVISPMWDRKQFNKCALATYNIVDKSSIYRLRCTKDKEAVDVIKREIDKKSKKNIKMN